LRNDKRELANFHRQKKEKRKMKRKKFKLNLERHLAKIFELVVFHKMYVMNIILTFCLFIIFRLHILNMYIILVILFVKF